MTSPEATPNPQNAAAAHAAHAVPAAAVEPMPGGPVAPLPARVLVVTAHPDDVDFGAAGTVAALTVAGAEVAYCIVTSGDAGWSDRSMPRPEIARIREAEQRAAAKVVGVSDVTFLGYADGEVEATLALRRDITRQIRRFRPEVVLTMSPERNWDRIIASHPDHLATAEAAVSASYPDAENHFAHRDLLDEGLEPHKLHELWVIGGAVGVPFFVDVTDTFDAKLAALRAHASQTAGRDELEGLVRGWAASVAASNGLAEGRLAEVFGRVRW